MTYQARKALVSAYLGKTVTVKIDRPIGYIHKKENKTLVYPINYGYIPGVMGGDGEELDVYLLGVCEPVFEYTCRVIGIIHRENDIEDKLVAAPEGMVFDQTQIASLVDFQEKYYKTTVEAIYQKSCGIVLFRRYSGELQFLVLRQSVSQSWSFPKGHMEMGETEMETAKREAFEETGITKFDFIDFRIETSYVLGNFVHKKLVLFAAQTDEIPHIMNNEEISEYRFASPKEAKKLLHPDCREIIEALERILK